MIIKGDAKLTLSLLRSETPPPPPNYGTFYVPMVIRKSICFKIPNWKKTEFVLCVYISSFESQKGFITIQRCSTENQKGINHCTKSMVIAPFWFSTEHDWTVITPSWLSIDDVFEVRRLFSCTKRHIWNRIISSVPWSIDLVYNYYYYHYY